MKNIFAKIKKPKVLRTLIVIVIVCISVVGVVFYQLREGRISIDNSLIQAPIISIAPAIPGKLTAIYVYEGEKIKKGDSLATVNGQTLYADTNGLVIMANNQIGSLVSASSPVVQLVNTQDERVAGTIDENKGLSDIRVGQIVSFTVDAFPGKVFWGYVDEISPTAKQTQMAFSISSERPTQQFVVYAKFDANAYSKIRNGMSAKMTVYTNTK